MSPFKGDILRHASSSTPFLKTEGSRNISKTIGDIKFQDARLSRTKYFLNLIPHFDLLISWLPFIVQKSFCTPDGAMCITFQMNYVPAF